MLGEFTESDRKQASRIMIGRPLSPALIIFLLLRISVGSWLMAGLSFLSLPAALVGGYPGGLDLQ